MESTRLELATPALQTQIFHLTRGGQKMRKPWKNRRFCELRKIALDTGLAVHWIHIQLLSSE
jgi:hypothetical protein